MNPGDSLALSLLPRLYVPKIFEILRNSWHGLCFQQPPITSNIHSRALFTSNIAIAFQLTIQYPVQPSTLAQVPLLPHRHILTTSLKKKTLCLSMGPNPVICYYKHRFTIILLRTSDAGGINRPVFPDKCFGMVADSNTAKSPSSTA